MRDYVLLWFWKNDLGFMQDAFPFLLPSPLTSSSCPGRLDTDLWWMGIISKQLARERRVRLETIPHTVFLNAQCGPAMSLDQVTGSVRVSLWLQVCIIIHYLAPLIQMCCSLAPIFSSRVVTIPCGFCTSYPDSYK